MKKHSILKRLASGFLAGLCAASMNGTNLSGIPTEAAESTENTAFPSADSVIAQAANLLGAPYSFGYKGYTGVYYQGSYKPLTEEYIRTQGIDCSGLVYYTLTHLGYSTSGFDWNNPVPVDTVHWLSMDKDCTITYGGVTSKLDIEKQNIKTEEHPYWECADGSTITAGSVVVSETKDINHAWIYMGEFENRDAVVQYLRSIGVSEHLINDKTVGSGNGSGGKHWRIESNGSQGVVINNNTDGKNTSALNTSAFRIAQADVQFTLCKVDAETSMAIGKSSVDGSTAVYGIYSDNACKNKVAEIPIGEDGMGSVKLKSGTYYAKEISAPTGYALDETVYTLSGSGMTTVKESPSYGKILINKTAEDGVIGGRTFEVVNNTTGERWTEVTNENGVAVFGDDADERLLVYDVRNAGTACDYTISEVNVDSRYNVPKAQNVSLANGTVDLTVTAAFVNELKTGGLKINKQSEDGQNGDRTFTVTGGGNSYTITTGSDGTAILSDIPVFDSNNEKIVYTISEQDVPVRYVVPADQTATLTADATVDVSFENVLKKFTVEVTKEDKEHHNAVFVGVDASGTPRQAHKRSTITFGSGFRLTCEGSDTRYSFAHFGESQRLYVFEAPIDMLSFLTLYPKRWENKSYIAINGVYEHAVLTALQEHPHITDIVLCTDNDEGGMDAADRLRDVLKNAGYTRFYRHLSEYKDFNEDLKARHGVQPLPAVPHRRKEAYFSQVQAIQLRKFAPERLRSLLQSALANGQYHTLAEYALSGSAYFLGDAGMFAKLKTKLSQQYRAYTDKGRMQTKQDNLNTAFSAVFRDFKQNARTREQCVQTAKLLYELAYCAIRCETQSSMEISTEPYEELENEPEQQVSQGW